MKRRFVVGIDHETSEDVSSFLKYIRQHKFGWWHWIGNLWLLTTHNEKITAVAIRDKLAQITGGKTAVVIEVTSITWATRRHTGKKEDISKWIRDQWHKS